MKNALNNQVGMLGDMFLWLVANLKQGVIYFIKQALPPNKSAGSVRLEFSSDNPALNGIWTNVAHLHTERVKKCRARMDQCLSPMHNLP